MVSPADILNAKVLIVDDQEANVRLLERILQNAGYASVARTRDPHEVAAMHGTNRYDLIVLDLEMPGMDGFQVMEALKDIEEDGDLTVLVMTAHPGHKLRALQAGAKDFISKPFDAVEVLTRIRNMLEVRLLRVEVRLSGRAPEAPIAVRPDDEIRHLAPEFLEKRQADVLRLTEALAQNDLAQIQRLGQRLNGTGLSYGFDGISEIGGALEQAARLGDVVEVRRRVALLSDYLQRVHVIP
jgi:CheY-like chemotaxis protein